MKVVFTHAAEIDLGFIVDHIAEDNPTRALSFVLELRESCAGLADLPFGYSVARRLAGSDIRRRVHGNYLIFYRVHENRIEVLRILHGAMDYERLFAPDE
ncbi:type II toxin-antitoxin system RelE/ParE family toxin [Aminobacter anthyllidis]|uniref:Type II toxin-antitoxin system RelE/ParE family toxin n=1 Tax=Aminobacter anthyllidis TaxID=1035067 RepID=A0A9X1AAX2_9HYPH|nr:type II toxin-antitoxin system RelE/ParE family toxin [Aminobacter anthyllidis]